MSLAAIALIIIGVTLVMMIGQWIPMAVTALAAAFAMAAFGVMSFSDVLAQFGTSSFFCVVGMMVVGGALFDTGIVNDIGVFLLNRGNKKNNGKLFAAVIIVAVTLLSAFLSNTTCAAMFLPLATLLGKRANDMAEKKNLKMFVGVAATLGGCMTLVGSPSQHSMAQELLAEIGSQPMSFFYGVPATSLMLLLTVAYFLIAGSRLGGNSSLEAEAEEPNGPKRFDLDKKPAWKKLTAALILLLSIVLIATGAVSSGAGAMIGAVFCVLTGCLSLESAIGKISWPVVIMFGGLLGISRGFNQSGAGQVVIDLTITLLGKDAHPYIVFCVVMLVGVILTNVLDNIAAQALLGPISLSLAAAYGINATTMAYATLFACNLAFATPIGTPAMSMTLVGGYKFSDYLKVGGPLCAIGYVFLVTVVPLIYGFWA